MRALNMGCRFRRRYHLGTVEGPETTAGFEIPGPKVKLDLLILLLLCLVMFFFSLGSRPLWDTDEGMHAATSKDMVTSGDWITPRLNGEPFHDKPALFNWMVALSFLVFGFTELAARLPGAVLGTGLVLVTYLLGWRMFGRNVALAGGVVLATSLEMIVVSRSVLHDSALVFFVTLALLFFWQAFSGGPRRMLWLLLCSASCGLAVLAKGPVGVVLPTLVVVPFLLVRRRPGFFRVSELVLGALVFVVVVALWYVPVALRNPDYAGYFFIKQNLMNFLSSESNHPGPLHFYVVGLLGGFFPWSFLLPVAVWIAAGRQPEETLPARQFLVIWLAAVFLFFTVASSKLITYILPLFPAAALLVGHAWDELATRSRPRRVFSISLLAAVSVFVIAAVAFRIQPPLVWHSKYGIEMGPLRLLLWLVLGCWLATLGLHLAHRTWRSFAAIAAMMVFFVVIVTVAIVPEIDPYRSSVRLARQLDRLLSPGEPLLFYQRLQDSALFYTDRRAVVLHQPAELVDLMRRHDPVYCVLTGWRYQDLVEKGFVFGVLDREGNTLLISNRADASPLHDPRSTR
jgi:4-amino-4-deoxy-L-arabinose transferase-like glycosyltransferase